MRDVRTEGLDRFAGGGYAAAFFSHVRQSSAPVARAVFELVSRVGVDSVLAAATIAILVALSLVRHLPMIAPSTAGASLVGVHYIYPLVGVAILAPGMAVRVAMNRSAFLCQILHAMLCYACILYAHFTFKLWIPHLNTVSYDGVFWDMDVKMHGVVQVFEVIRVLMAPMIPYSANFYVIGFIAMFYIGLIWQVKTVPEHVRELIIACMIMQILGTVGYLLAPAVGPFRYEHGVSPLATEQQGAMFEFYSQSVRHGAGWIAAHGAEAFTAGLAAMPSLHVAGATLFFMNARRHSRRLTMVFGFLLFFIVVNAVAARWHYLIDLPFGVAVAWISLKAASWLVRLEHRYRAERTVLRPALA